jgi:signal transduction histidine kinase
VVKLVVIRSHELLRSVSSQQHHFDSQKIPLIRIDERSEDILFKSDVVLLRRVLGNFLKNAVEASGDDETVTVGCRRLPEGIYVPGAASIKGKVPTALPTGGTTQIPSIEFWTHNPGVMAPDVRLQVFQRSFSTKGSGRGLGTYGAKLLTERFLKGRVTFTSTEEDGTTFSAILPLELKS